MVHQMDQENKVLIAGMICLAAVNIAALVFAPLIGIFLLIGSVSYADKILNHITKKKKGKNVRD